MTLNDVALIASAEKWGSQQPGLQFQSTKGRVGNFLVLSVRSQKHCRVFIASSFGTKHRDTHHVPPTVSVRLRLARTRR
eukprot:6363044-Amphidinium_carterae.1